MYSDDNHSENSNESSSEPTRADTIGAIRGILGRLDESDESRCEAHVDETGRFWLQDPTGPEETYIWSRATIDVEAVR